MQKRFFLAAILAVVSLSIIQAQSGVYDTFLKDGKRWVFSHQVYEYEAIPYVSELDTVYYYELVSDSVYNSYVTLQGDTVNPAGVVLKKAYFTDLYRDTTYLKELISIDDRGRMRMIDERGVHTGYNFGLEVGDACNVPNPLSLQVKYKDTIQVGERYFERMGFYSPQEYQGEGDQIVVRWIRGVGDEFNAILPPDYGPVTPNFHYSEQDGKWLREILTFHSCYDGDELLLSVDNFWNHSVSSVGEASLIQPRSVDAVYDLQGRKISNVDLQLPRGVYIQNGRKFVIK